MLVKQEPSEGPATDRVQVPTNMTPVDLDMPTPVPHISFQLYGRLRPNFGPIRGYERYGLMIDTCQFFPSLFPGEQS